MKSLHDYTENEVVTLIRDAMHTHVWSPIEAPFYACTCGVFGRRVSGEIRVARMGYGEPVFYEPQKHHRRADEYLPPALPDPDEWQDPGGDA